jgi:PEGA domain
MKLMRAAVCLLLCLQIALAQDQSASPNSSNQQTPPSQPASTTEQKSEQAPAGQPAPGAQPAAAAVAQAAPALNGFGLEDGTPVKLRLTRNLSSGTDKKGDTVDFEVMEDVSVNGTVVIPRGGIAWATITEAQPKRRMGRGGKLDVNIDSVRLRDGEKIPLRAVKENKGGGHVGAMTGAMVATGIVFFPAAPLFLFMHGKDINIPKGTEITAYVASNVPLDKAKFQDVQQPQGPATATAGQSTSLTVAEAEAIIALVSTPAGADVSVDDGFIGNAPAKLRLKPGKHTIKVSMTGYKDWTREMTVISGSEVNLTATLEKTN